MNIKEKFVTWGKYLQDSKLIHGSAGNLSFKQENEIFVTKSGSFLGRLNEDDVLSFNINGEVNKKATVEAVVHKEVYKNCIEANCVVHTHPLHIVSISLCYKDTFFEAIDEEGITYYGGKVPIIDAKSGTFELAEKVSTSLKNSNAVIVRGHGIFVKGESFEKAVNITASIENSANICYLVKNLKR